ncbi:MAG: AmpG family muropeptide MFS transporter [Deltaproteobacteria bacterium]|nr:AmpG family muropeptide MFS transporter [Deltaproteobacteria bacterium]
MPKDNRSPWLYVPTLYFAEGLPYIIVNTVSTIMYKKMGLSNEFIGLTSVMYLPWVIKMFWSPVVDVYKTRRAWIIASQLLLCALFGLLAACIPTGLFVPFTLTAFMLIAFISATHDIAVDGYYMLALSNQRQAFFLGIRSLFYRLSVIFGSGLMVVLAGTIEKKTGSIPASWSCVMAICALFFLAAFFYHRRYLPRPAADTPGSSPDQNKSFQTAFTTYFRQDNIAAIAAFILLYRLGEAMLAKMAAPFLLDSPATGGLGLATETVGYVYGTVGIVSLALGGILGGILISRFDLKRCIWPMAILLNAPDIFYIFMSLGSPTITTVCLLVAVEQFGYGLGFTAFSVFLMQIAREPYKTSHFAISTGLMALGMMLPGMASGLLQQALGYPWFFTIVTLLTIPGMVLILFIPLNDKNERD